MIEDKKYREIFKAQKRWAKSKGNYRRHVAGNTHFMIIPAQITYSKILELEKLKKITNYERLMMLLNFYEEQNEIEKNKADMEKRMRNHYYWDRIQEINNYIRKVENNEALVFIKL